MRIPDTLGVDEFCQRVLDCNLAEASDVNRCRSELPSSEYTVKDLIGIMTGKGVLTTLHVDKLLRNERHGYFFGKYKALYLIGAGTFARVYRASADDQDVYAVKVLRKRFRDDVGQLDQFLREGRMGLKLRHPNIVQIFDVNPDVHSPFMAMEFVEGSTLRELMRLRGALPPKTAIKLMHDIASGLKAAAVQGVSHRDLKLSNVLVDVSGTAKLVDFGLAALADRNNPEQVADCPNARAIDYAALERGTNVRKDDPRSDIYFAGAMLYHMLAGAPPLTETRDRLQRLNVSRFHEVTPIQKAQPGLPAPVISVLQRAMEVDPEKRTQSAAAFQADLAKAMELLAKAEQLEATGDTRMAKMLLEGEVSATNEGEGLVVLLVESKPDLQDAIRAALKKRGYRVLVIQ
ncbi:MAG: serine/threonine-protein kinase, partial [Planctomycetota bacterium]